MSCISCWHSICLAQQFYRSALFQCCRVWFLSLSCQIWPCRRCFSWISCSFWWLIVSRYQRWLRFSSSSRLQISWPSNILLEIMQTKSRQRAQFWMGICWIGAFTRCDALISKLSRFTSTTPPFFFTAPSSRQISMLKEGDLEWMKNSEVLASASSPLTNVWRLQWTNWRSFLRIWMDSSTLSLMRRHTRSIFKSTLYILYSILFQNYNRPPKLNYAPTNYALSLDYPTLLSLILIHHFFLKMFLTN